jgi:hypothetical protein
MCECYLCRRNIKYEKNENCHCESCILEYYKIDINVCKCDSHYCIICDTTYPIKRYDEILLNHDEYDKSIEFFIHHKCIENPFLKDGYQKCHYCISKKRNKKYKKKMKAYFKSHIWKELTEYVFNPIRLFTMAEKFGYDLAEYIELI